MEKEISSGAMLGIVLIALAAVIGLGFGIFAIARGTANEGVVGLQDNLGQVSTSAFSDYDQKIVTGTQVMSSYNNFAGKPYAILICTQAYKDDPSNSSITNTNAASAVDSAGTAIMVNKSTTGTTPLKFLQYNALLGGSSVEVTYSNGMYIANGGFKLTNGKIAFNSVTSNLSKSGLTEYVATSSRFQANLIKDSSGTILGIAFEQIGTK